MSTARSVRGHSRDLTKLPTANVLWESARRNTSQESMANVWNVYNTKNAVDINLVTPATWHWPEYNHILLEDIHALLLGAVASKCSVGRKPAEYHHV